MATSPRDATGVETRQDYLRNKATQYNCVAKSLLYGGNSRPATPIHHGKKSVPHPGDHNAAPFATFENVADSNNGVQGGQMSKTHVKLTGKKKEGASKVGMQEYDSDVYRQAIISNAANLSAQKSRNWGNSNILGQHPMTPKMDATTAEGLDGLTEGQLISSPVA